jgi:5-methylcytosine-specific restriction protein A
MFEIGRMYNRQTELHDKYGGNRESGIASCRAHPIIFLFSSPRGEEYGYKDGWNSKTEFSYTGEGQIGNMSMTRGNLQIRDHEENGKELHLFNKISSGTYEYVGQFKYLSHETKRGADSDGHSRDMIVFLLQSVNS